MKTIFVFATSIVMMFVMYIYFIAICLYALTVLPIIKLNEFIMSYIKVNQMAGVYSTENQ